MAKANRNTPDPDSFEGREVNAALAEISRSAYFGHDAARLIKDNLEGIELDMTDLTPAGLMGLIECVQSCLEKQWKLSHLLQVQLGVESLNWEDLHNRSFEFSEGNPVSKTNLCSSRPQATGGEL